jgi:hypothetical protein
VSWQRVTSSCASRKGAKARVVASSSATPAIQPRQALTSAQSTTAAPHTPPTSGQCFEPEWLARHPIEFIETYEIGEWDRGELPEASSAKELEERIRTLGYIE